MKNFFKKNQRRGFSIMEIVLVIFLASYSLIGIMSLATQNIQVGYHNKNVMIASQLAQEGLELVRNIRDNNWLYSYHWKRGNYSETDYDIIGDKTYSITVDSDGDGRTDIINVSDITDPKAKLYLNASNLYVNVNSSSGLAPTIFSRMITIKTGDADDDASTTVSCLVQWRRDKNVYQYEADTILYNWR